jgi:YrbI family 3-deoxy-D-manno-octulosonate 8-phosphate phosphatase
LTHPLGQVQERAPNVRLLCVDVDGVLTDAGMYCGPDGEVLKRFNTRDGVGLARVREARVAVAIISGEDGAIVHARGAKLNIDDVFCNVSSKRVAIEKLCAEHRIGPGQVACIGDDLNDLSALECVGLPRAVADAAAPVLTIANYVAQRGGDGAVSERCEPLIAARA